MSRHLEKLDQAVTVLTLTMGLCVMWEGYADLSEASNAATWPAYHDGTAQLSGFDISSPAASGGNRIQVTFTFSDLTPIGGAVVKMTSTDPSLLPVSDVPVPAGSKSWRFSIPINPSTTPESVVITARYGGIAKSVVVMVRAYAHNDVCQELAGEALTGYGKRQLSGRCTLMHTDKKTKLFAFNRRSSVLIRGPRS